MYKHMDVRKAWGKSFDEADFLSFCLDAGIPSEYQNTRLSFNEEEGIAARALRLFSYGWFENTQGMITSYVSFSEKPGGFCLMIMRHHDRNTGKPVTGFFREVIR